MAKKIVHVPIDAFLEDLAQTLECDDQHDVQVVATIVSKLFQSEEPLEQIENVIVDLNILARKRSLK